MAFLKGSEQQIWNRKPRDSSGLRGWNLFSLPPPIRGRISSGNGCGGFGRFAVCRAIALLALLAAMVGVKQNARAEVSREYQLKAVFLFRFAQFTTWPTNSFATTNAPIVIGILGANPFGSALAEAVHGEMVEGRPLVLRYYNRVEEIKTCHILFISQSEARNLGRIVNDLKGRPILTASDIIEAARHGVMVQFVTEFNKIHLRINLKAVQAAKLDISSKVLHLAQIFDPDNP